MRWGIGETGSELSCEDFDRLLSEGESLLLLESREVGREFERCEGELCNEEGVGERETVGGILIVLFGR
jgi:hypothetical protein